MRTSVEPLEGNKVKLSVEVDEGEFERAVDAAFRKIAREIRVPGFRPGKAPRRLLEARVGADVARQEALREALPDYYAKALKESDVDAIAPPEIDITAGREAGAVAFDAVVEVRPNVRVPGYGGLKATVPSPVVTEEDVDAQVDRLRGQFGELQAVSRPARDGDHVSIDIKGYRHDETIEGLSASDLLHEVGSGAVVPQLDEQLRGARPGDILKFNAPVDGQPDDVSFQVLVKEVNNKVLPDVTDEWASEASEFETVDELRADIRQRMSTVKRLQAQLALQDSVLEALVELVEDDAPGPLVGAEMERSLHDLGHRLEGQGVGLAEYLEATGRTQEELLESVQTGAVRSVKADLALRTVADEEAIEVTDEELQGAVDRLAQRSGEKPAALRRRLERAEQMAAVLSDIRKGKALEWLVDHAEVVDEEGRPVSRDDLTPPAVADVAETAQEIASAEETEE